MDAGASAPAPVPSPGRPPIRNLRWIICGLLFIATTINYVDRQTISVLNKVVLQKEIGWDEAGYGWILFAFQLAYAIMFSVSGRLLDRFGVRAGMIWAVIIWSLAAIGHAFARSTFGFAVARFCLALGEAANFPACVKAVTEWFPKRQRALANGFFNAGTNVGVMLSFLIVWVSSTMGWQAAFVITGVLGFGWLALWMLIFRSPEQHPRLSEEERALILSDREPPPKRTHIPWTALLRYRQAWAFFVAKLMTDPVWWFYLYWLPAYLSKERGLGGISGAAVLIFPYTAATIGSLVAGWLSGALLRRGWPVGKARLVVMLGCALGMPGAIAAVMTDNFHVAIALISLATGCHQAWGANLFTLPTDMFPKQAVGSVVGLGSTGGAIGGLFMTLVAGGMLQWLGSYKPLFFMAGVMHLGALLAIYLLTRADFTPVDLDSGIERERSPVLAALGGGVGAIGLALVTLVVVNWAAIVAATRSPSTAAAGLVASTGLVAIGAILMYAARPQRA